MFKVTNKREIMVHLTRLYFQIYSLSKKHDKIIKLIYLKNKNNNINSKII